MSVPPVSSDRQAFYAAILNHWEDDTPRLIFADWLDEQDHPAGHLRAEMIRIGVEARTCTAGRKSPSARLLSRLQKAESAFRAAFLPRRVYLDDARFERGFINDWIVRSDSADSYLGKPQNFHDDLGPVNFPPIYFGASPTPGTPSVDYVRLAEHPALRLWHTLPIYAGWGDSGQLGDDNFAALIRSPHLSGLRQIEAIDHARREQEHQEYLSPLGLRAMHALAGNPALAKLTHLTLWWNGLKDDAIRALAGSPHLRNLKKLSLADHFTDEAVLALAGSPILDSVESLHLYGPLDGSALQALLQSAHLQALRELDLSGYTSGCHENDNLHFGGDWNMLDPVGFRALLDSPVLGRLKRLRLQMPYETSERTWDELAAAVGRMPALEQLDMHGDAYLMHRRLPRRWHRLLFEWGKPYRAPG